MAMRLCMAPIFRETDLCSGSIERAAPYFRTRSFRWRQLDRRRRREHWRSIATAMLTLRAIPGPTEYRPKTLSRRAARHGRASMLRMARFYRPHIFPARLLRRWRVRLLRADQVRAYLSWLWPLRRL